jgi:hypothetical protein
MSTHALFIVIRVVGRHIKVFTGNVIRAGTYDGKSTNKNEISLKLTALSTGDSARYKEILLSGRKYWGKKLVL